MNMGLYLESWTDLKYASARPHPAHEQPRYDLLLFYVLAKTTTLALLICPVACFPFLIKLSFSKKKKKELGWTSFFTLETHPLV